MTWEKGRGEKGRGRIEGEREIYKKGEGKN
jgi:hypothetical protein